MNSGIPYLSERVRVRFKLYEIWTFLRNIYHVSGTRPYVPTAHMQTLFISPLFAVLV